MLRAVCVFRALDLTILLHCTAAVRPADGGLQVQKQPVPRSQVIHPVLSKPPLSNPSPAAWPSRTFRDCTMAASRWLDSSADAAGAMLGRGAWTGKTEPVVLRMQSLRRHRRQLAQSTSPTPTPTEVRLCSLCAPVTLGCGIRPCAGSPCQDGAAVHGASLPLSPRWLAGFERPPCELCADHGRLTALVACCDRAVCCVQTPASIQSQVENTVSSSLSPNEKHWIKIAIIIGIVVAALCLLSLVCCLVRCICWPCCCLARSIK